MLRIKEQYANQDAKNVVYLTNHSVTSYHTLRLKVTRDNSFQ